MIRKIKKKVLEKISLTSDKRDGKSCGILKTFLRFFAILFTIHQNRRKVFTTFSLSQNFPNTPYFLEICIAHHEIGNPFTTVKSAIHRGQLLIPHNQLKLFNYRINTAAQIFHLIRHVDEFIDFPRFFSPKKPFPTFCREKFHEREKRTREKFYTNTNEFIIIFTRNQIAQKFSFHEGKKVKYRKCHMVMSLILEKEVSASSVNQSSLRVRQTPCRTHRLTCSVVPKSASNTSPTPIAFLRFDVV